MKIYKSFNSWLSALPTESSWGRLGKKTYFILDVEGKLQIADLNLLERVQRFISEKMAYVRGQRSIGSKLRDINFETLYDQVVRSSLTPEQKSEAKTFIDRVKKLQYRELKLVLKTLKKLDFRDFDGKGRREQESRINLLFDNQIIRDKFFNDLWERGFKGESYTEDALYTFLKLHKNELIRFFEFKLNPTMGAPEKLDGITWPNFVNSEQQDMWVLLEKKEVLEPFQVFLDKEGVNKKLHFMDSLKRFHRAFKDVYETGDSKIISGLIGGYITCLHEWLNYGPFIDSLSKNESQKIINHYEEIRQLCKCPAPEVSVPEDKNVIVHAIDNLEKDLENGLNQLWLKFLETPEAKAVLNLPSTNTQ